MHEWHPLVDPMYQPTGITEREVHAQIQQAAQVLGHEHLNVQAQEAARRGALDQQRQQIEFAQRADAERHHVIQQQQYAAAVAAGQWSARPVLDTSTGEHQTYPARTVPSPRVDGVPARAIVPANRQSATAQTSSQMTSLRLPAPGVLAVIFFALPFLAALAAGAGIVPNDATWIIVVGFALGIVFTCVAAIDG